MSGRSLKDYIKAVYDESKSAGIYPDGNAILISATLACLLDTVFLAVEKTASVVMAEYKKSE